MTTQPVPQVRSFQGELLVLGGYLLLTLLFTYPLGFQLGSAAAGVIGDAEEYLWSFWWMRKAALELHTSPFFTDRLYFPQGVSLYFFASNPLHALLSIPLQALFGLVVAYNLMSLLTFIAAAYATYRLAHDLTGDRAAAFVAGIVFAFAPTQVFHFNVGQPNLYAVEFLPVYVLCLRRWLAPRRPTTDHRPSEVEDRGLKIEDSNVGASEKQSSILDPRSSIRWLLGAAIALALSSLADWQFAVYLQLFTAALLLAELLARRRAWRAALWDLGRRTLALQVLYALAVAPVLLPMIAELRGPQPYMFRGRDDTIYHSADLLAFFVPNPEHPLWRDWARPLNAALQTPGILVTTVSLSYVALLLAILAVVRDWQRARFWVLCGLGFLILALGPQLRLLGDVTQILLPYEFLFQLPIIRISRAPARYVTLALLCLAMLVALGLQTLRTTISRDKVTRRQGDKVTKTGESITVSPLHRDKVTRRQGDKVTKTGESITVSPLHRVTLSGMSVVVVVALCFELLPAPVRSQPLAAVPSFFIDGTLREAGALLEAPDPANRGMYYATLHDRPILYGEISRDNPAGPLLRYLREGLFTQGDDIFDYARNWECMAAAHHVTHLVVYRRDTPEARAARQAADQRLGPAALVRDTPPAALYRLPDPGADSTCLLFGPGWYAPRSFGAGQPLYRWTDQRATLGLLRRTPGRVKLRFAVHSFAIPRQLQVRRGEELLAQAPVGGEPSPVTLELDLPAGLTLLELSSVEPAVSPADYGYNEHDPIAIGYSGMMVVEGQ